MEKLVTIRDYRTKIINLYIDMLMMDKNDLKECDVKILECLANHPTIQKVLEEKR